jgi:hypothetical protein
MQVAYRQPTSVDDRPWPLAVRAVAIAFGIFGGVIASSVHGALLAKSDFAVVNQSVQAYFATVPGYQPGDLITQSQIAGALARIEDDGQVLAFAEALVSRGVPDGSFLAREFSTPTGRRFIRKAGKYAGGYERLDRLSSIPRGEATIRQLASERGGDKLIEYLATTKGGKNLGSMMAGVRQGVDLNKPTGRIYTAEELLSAIAAGLAAPQK